ncbi:MAG: hypothetical protein O2931_10270 [Planctomycetota bacterium]|nr:hypothetical protein [Planctomycetota bacterium]MDA1179167.1 hypothetical protein [Planctomycetota bacterium]
MKVKSTRWIGGCGLTVAVLAVSLFQPADGQQGIPVPGQDRVFNHVPSVAETPQFGSGPDSAESKGTSSGSLIAFSSVLANGQQQIVVIDSAQYVLSVYRVLADSGAISLISVRNIRSDSAIDNFNSDSFLPEEIRKMVPK